MIDQAMVARLFDADWYLATYPDATGQNPLEHFRQVGAAEGRDPNPLFHMAWYLRQYPDVAVAGMNGLEDYVSQGAALGRDPGPLLSTRWYLASNPDVAAAGLNALEHYLVWGPRQLRDPSPVFDSAWYFASYPDAVVPGVDARLHYMRDGARLGYDPCPLFSTRWYLDSYPEVAASGVNPLLHYLVQGAAQGFDPSPHFSTCAYRETHGEMAAGENPLVHYLIHDPARGRIIPPIAGSLPGPLSRTVIDEVRSVIQALAAIEPDLAALPDTLEEIRIHPRGPERSEQAWRGLYLSLHDLPRRIVLVGSIDDAPELAGLAKKAGGVLIVETDTATVSVAETLPRGTQWRSLSEFGPNLDWEDRVNIVTALVSSLQPAALLVWGSRAGWETLTRYGAAMRRSTALFATAAASPDFSSAILLRGYFRACIPLLSALHAADVSELHQIAEQFGLPPSEYEKLRDFQQWHGSDGFLSVLGTRCEA